MGPLLQLVKVPLGDIPSLQRIDHITQLGILCQCAECALDSTVCVADEGIKQYSS